MPYKKIETHIHLDSLTLQPHDNFYMGNCRKWGKAAATRVVSLRQLLIKDTPVKS